MVTMTIIMTIIMTTPSIAAMGMCTAARSSRRRAMPIRKGPVMDPRMTPGRRACRIICTSMLTMRACRDRHSVSTRACRRHRRCHPWRCPRTAFRCPDAMAATRTESILVAAVHHRSCTRCAPSVFRYELTEAHRIIRSALRLAIAFRPRGMHLPAEHGNVPSSVHRGFDGLGMPRGVHVRAT